MSRGSDIKAIHAIARDLALDEATRRAAYLRLTGCSGLSVMSDEQAGAVAAYFRGLAPKKGGAPARRKPSPKAHVRKVYALWWRLADAKLVAADARSSEERRAALNAFLNERFASDLGGATAEADFLSVALAGKAAEAFKAIAARHKLKLE